MEEHRANPGVRELPQAHGPAGFRARELRRRRRLAHERPARANRIRPPSWPTAAAWPVRRRCARRSCCQAGRVRRHHDREDADLRARPRARILRHAGRAVDRARRRPQRLPLHVHRARRRQEHAVPDESERSSRARSHVRRLVDPKAQESRDVRSARRSLPRRTFLRGMGVTLALPLLDAMVPAMTAQSRTARRAGAPLRRGLRAARQDSVAVDAGGGGHGVRVHADPEAARALPRSRRVS